jgi:putative glycosyltransferase (TIGR04372 family)
MVFRRFRKSLKPWLNRHPAALGLYERVSWVARAQKRFFPKLVDTFFPMWIAPRVRLAERYFGRAPEKAIAIIDDVLARKPDLHRDDQIFHRIASIYFLNGRYQDARRLFQKVEERRREVARELQYDRLNLRFFPRAGFSNIGPLGMLDTYAKAQILGIIPKRTNIITGAPEEFANPAYLRYWMKYFSLISHPRTISLLAPISCCLEERSNMMWCGGGGMRGLVAIAREAQLQWEAEGRRPLLELSAEHRERGCRMLRELGVPQGAWFVGLHVRDGSDRLNLRNADIGTYRLAVEEIARRGGWVVRMGDRSMRPLPPWPNAIDYAHSRKREDWMDVFLWAEGRFFIGTASGPQVIPTSFGRAVAITNYGPIANLLCGKEDILLPKHYWHEAEARYLTIAERMAPEYAFQESIQALAKFGIRIIDNTAEELCELVAEMLDRAEGRHAETEEESALQQRFAEIAAKYEFYPIKIARAFISRHPELFGASTAGESPRRDPYRGLAGARKN